ncbi:MAG: butyrate kinase [Defluviitaleaceae bacterium]|nr:butyrate kinase [Defluviitaleaceae bacterium]
MKLLIINPGSTSTKIGVFDNDTSIYESTLRHSIGELAPYKKMTDQYDFRMGIIVDALAEAGIDVATLDAVVGRGGLVKPLEGGTYHVNDAMLEDLRIGVQGQHASNLGGLIAHAIGSKIGKPSFIVDPVVVDEFMEISRISGHPLIQRRSIFHALNQKAIARQYAKDVGKNYADLNLIVVHMGGGISVGMHAKGRVIDVNNALDGEGPLSPERSGTLPTGDLAALCFSGDYSHADVKKMIAGNGGLVAYFGSNDLRELEERAKTNPAVQVAIDAMCYQIAKEIGAMSTAVYGDVDAILLTGGIAHSQYITGEVTKRVKFIADVKKYPGEDELAALAQGALRVLRGEEAAKEYK